LESKILAQRTSTQLLYLAQRVEEIACKAHILDENARQLARTVQTLSDRVDFLTPELEGIIRLHFEIFSNRFGSVISSTTPFLALQDEHNNATATPSNSLEFARANIKKRDIRLFSKAVHRLTTSEYDETQLLSSTHLAPVTAGIDNNPLQQKTN
jgi:hypothetical protein